MKALLVTTAAAAFIALAGPVSAQTVQPTMPAPTQQTPYQQMSTPPWMQDDGSSSDHPIHNPGDFSASRLNSQYGSGLTVPPGQGFPARLDQQ